ncbi:hypothetical protein WME89_33615 [Sorangium sp. So ce321]|uniref:hypothetical protein n=1 Tax=Sorangium sp. So ce321 TaxID=3133300 RepID=UPI003F60C4B1
MRCRAQVLFQVGAWAWVVTGIGHLAITALLLGRPATPPRRPRSSARRGRTG